MADGEYEYYYDEYEVTVGDEEAVKKALVAAVEGVASLEGMTLEALRAAVEAGSRVAEIKVAVEAEREAHRKKMAALEAELVEEEKRAAALEAVAPLLKQLKPAPAAAGDGGPARAFSQAHLSKMYRMLGPAGDADHVVPVKMLEFVTADGYANVGKLATQYVAETAVPFRTAEAKILARLVETFPETAERLVACKGLVARAMVSLTAPAAPASMAFAEASLVGLLLHQETQLPVEVVATAFSPQVLDALLLAVVAHETDPDETLLDALLRLVLLVNVAAAGDEGPGKLSLVVQALLRASDVKAVVEYVPRLFNGGPTGYHSMVAGEPVLKMLLDIFASPASLSLLYPNDVHVVLNVIVRELNNLDPESPKRMYMLRILEAYFSNSDYGSGAEEPYKIAEFQTTLDSIHSEDGEASEMSRLMVEAIYMSCEVLATWRPPAP
ncbi:uncharacterized protein AMSG_09524 [Thecamonas trahens ATCC 50062]|uniref:SPIN90/Ldb17 leucine-rich domain-containing protein n=1 Tax=Thecamonas trahens ATCC 50062 TaxID=461836 RepID=A0A0L0DNB6_THETB|nr:hypothetical protein AMSG_09524 [Thecamonas trahens ATCC 50062]KNC53802.1 hypothetical protein AMSG_09524 [Thecamonas trahens ATCC 50062]|eukprot:XP_013754362.1 hypothetical protein AMSG_09524 [Thecamonas trahens ATCC 50062]